MDNSEIGYANEIRTRVYPVYSADSVDWMAFSQHHIPWRPVKSLFWFLLISFVIGCLIRDRSKVTIVGCAVLVVAVVGMLR